MHFSNGRFSNKETGFSGPYVVWSLLGAPGEKKREILKTKCIYRRVEKKLAPERRFFIKKETLLLEGALVYLRSWERMRGLSGPSTFDQ